MQLSKEIELLNGIDDVLHTCIPSRHVFERLLELYLQFLKLDNGALMFCVHGHLIALAKYTDGRFVEPYEWWILNQHTGCSYLAENRYDTHTLENVTISWLDQKFSTEWRQGVITLIPIATETEALGAIVLVPPTDYAFDESGLRIGQIIGARIADWFVQRQFVEKDEYLANISQGISRLSGLTSSITDKSELINTFINRIRDEFGYYYVGLYLLVDGTKFAKLQAGTGKAGQILMQRGNRPIVGGASMVGQVSKNGKARMALDVEDDIAEFNLPLLPETRSVLGLPLIGEKLFGALVIYSFEKDAFSDEHISLFQPLVDELVDILEEL